MPDAAAAASVPPSSARRTAAAWALLVALYLILRVPALLGNSATYDEPIYVGASIHWTAFRDDRAAAMLYHPPLSYHLIDLPLRALDVPVTAWDASGPSTQAGLDVIYGSSRDGAPVAPETVLALARLPILLVGALGLPLLFWLGRRLGGDAAGWIAAAAWAAFPEAAAQSVQATTDCVAAVAALFLAFAAIRFADESRRDGRPPAVLLGFAFGVALLAKHTLLVHLAVAVAALFIVRAWTWRRAVTVAAIAASTVWAGYVFEFRPAVPETGPHETLDRVATALGLDPKALEGPARAIPVPAPTYFRSVLDALFSKATARSGTPWVAYMDGAWSERGFLSYFPYATIVKTPIALLLLVGACALSFRGTAPGRRSAHFIVCALLVVPFAAAVASRLNIGFRHLLPTLPFAFALGAAGLASLPQVRRATVVACACALLAVESLRFVGDPIPAANFASGGPEQLHLRLADSNLEMGQDMGRVRAWADANGVSRILAVLHGPPGLYDRECDRDARLERFTIAPTGGELRAIRPEDQTDVAAMRGRRFLAVGESVVVLPRWNCLLAVPPAAVVGRTRIYVRPE